MIFFYNILFFVGLVLGFLLIVPMVLMSGKRRETVLQRLGLGPLPSGLAKKKCCHLEKKRIWIHALSVGEVLSAVPLVKGLKEYSNNTDLVFSASTKTGFDTANQHLEGFVCAIFYFPYDLAFSVKHIAKKIVPQVVVIVETDIWPNFLFEMKRRDIPVILVNARLSKRSFRSYKRFRFFTKRLFLIFTNICTQSEADLRLFRALGVPSDRITTTGNVKFDEAHRFPDSEEVGKIRQSMQIQHNQKVFLAGSTHPGEEGMLLDAFSKIKNRVSDLLLIVAPRNPERARSVYRMFDSAGFAVGLVKELEKISFGNKLDVIIIDTIGHLKTLYAIADIAFVGGSLVNCGGHNPLEPAAFSKPIIFGYDMSDFTAISELLLEAEGAVRVEDAKDLYHAIASFIDDDKNALRIGKNAFKVFNANKGAVEKTMKVIKAYL